METANSWELKHTDDVYPNTRQFRLGGKSGRSFGSRRLEYMGDLSRHWDVAGHLISNGDQIRGEGQARQENQQCRWKCKTKRFGK